MSSLRWFNAAVASLLVSAAFTLPAAAENEIDFVERFALAEDRAKALEELIPGTEKYYFYRALHFQNTSQQEKLEETLGQWKKRFRSSGLRDTIERRSRIKNYDKDPKATLEWLRQALGVHFAHQRDREPGQKPDLPTGLKPELVNRKAYIDRALSNGSNLGEFQDSALDWILRDGGVELDSARRRALLSRLKRPDYDKLPALVVADLRTKESRGFGEFNIHRQLLKSQLDSILKDMPALRTNTNFINTYLTKLAPTADQSLEDDEVRLAHLNRMWEFVEDLPPAHNSLKANILYSLLDHRRKQGEYDRDLFATYVKLPRSMHYAEPKYYGDVEMRRYPTNLNQAFSDFTRCQTIGNDTALVRDFLLHILLEQDDIKPWDEWLRDSFVKPIMAEAKIVSGAKDTERWASMLTPSAYQALKDRVDIDLAITNPQSFAVDEEVTLTCMVKNVDKLLVKVYEVNAFNVYLATGREINTALALDGLVAGSEEAHEYDETPFRRVTREFTFPELTGKRGVWMIELIGGGRSSRALVRKGHLHYLSRQSVAGTVLTILDDEDKPAVDATAWIAGREYKPNKDGNITIPYSTSPGRRSMILRSTEGIASLDKFNHPAEQYSFNAGFFVDRESLRVGGEANLLVRPDFRVNGVAAPLSLLEQVKLTITSSNLDGVSTTQEVPDFELQAGKESEYTFAVPPRLAGIQFQLTAQVKQISTGNKVGLSANSTRTLNLIDREVQPFDLHLSRFDGHAVVEVLGKTGERLADKAVRFEIEHRDFREKYNVSLKSDGAGRIDLGKLPGIVRVTARTDGAKDNTWSFPLGSDSHSRPPVLHAAEGDAIHLPHIGAAKITRGQYSLLEKRGNTYVNDHFKKIRNVFGFLVIEDLPAGDFSLVIKEENREIPIRVTAGKMVGRFAAGKHRILESGYPLPLHITSVSERKGDVVVQLANADDGVRVHVLASRFEPPFPLKNALGPAYQPPVLSRTRATSRNLYLSGRDIGDEYRYILDRQEQIPLPGNMLTRPGLLLNPWAIRDTDTGSQQAAMGGEYGALTGERGGSDAVANGYGGAALKQLSDFSNLDFLMNSGVVLTNLTPDDEAIVRIPKEKLADRQDIHIVAIGPTDTVYKRVSLSDAEAEFRDMRLPKTLDLDQHFTERKEVATLRAGGKLKIADITAAELQEYDTLASIYSLYVTRSGNANLAKFAFVLNWDDLEPNQQKDKYSEFACHELSFYLSRKDPKFFKQVILPYLANKKDKTFLDEYLLEGDLKSYLDPWAYSRLNMAERVLLADRLGDDERSATKRHLADLFSQLKPDPSAKDLLFSTALRGQSLSRGRGVAGKLGDFSDFARNGTRYTNSNGVADGGFRTGMAFDAPAATAPPAPNDAAPMEEMAESIPVARKPAAMDRRKSSSGRERYRELAKEVERLEDEMHLGLDKAGWKYAGRDGDFERELAERKSIRNFYRKMPAVKEWAENNYYQVRIQQQLAQRVAINAFWSDYAAHLADDADSPFLSEHVAVPTSNFSEMMLALAVLDLPTEAGDHKVDREEIEVSFEAASPTIMFHKQIEPAPLAEGESPVLVGQNFFRNGDRYQVIDGVNRDKYVTEEFLPGVVYGCQVVVTNPTSAAQSLNVLVQIPEKSMPVSGSKRTRSIPLQLGPYATQKLEYFFYFPNTGDFAHYPVQVAKSETAVAWAEPFTFHVVEKLSKIDTASWDYISQWGTPADVIEYLEQNNVHQLNLDRIAWRMRDVDFFDKTIKLLATRHAYNATLWSYGVYHDRLPRTQEYLRHRDDFLRRLGEHIDCTLVTVDPVERHWIEHLEYSPLVNARAHRLGRDRKIVNSAFREQYHRVMNVLKYKQSLSDEDKLDVVYYLLLQDRVPEALKMFDGIDTDDLSTQLQLDYLRCYIAFYREQPGEAKDIAKQYANHPVDKWRNRFTNVLDQVREIGGGESDSEAEDDDRQGQQDQLAASEPSLEMKLEGGKVKLTYQNLKTVTVNYYEMDLEFLFSSNPFVASEAERFSVIKPNKSVEVKLDGKSDTFEFAVEKEFANKNVLIDVVGSGRRVAEAYYANQLKAQVVEQYGRLQVRHAKTGKPLSKVYVKVYARTPQGAKFFKDGYTDLRGKFDYTSLNTGEIDQVSEFAILVMSDEHGSVVKTAKPPQR